MSDTENAAGFVWSMASAANVQHRTNVEAAWLRLMVVGADRMESLKDEVKRRQELFSKVRRESPRSGEHPEIAAIRSVTSDVAAGYLT